METVSNQPKKEGVSSLQHELETLLDDLRQEISTVRYTIPWIVKKFVIEAAMMWRKCSESPRRFLIRLAQKSMDQWLTEKVYIIAESQYNRFMALLSWSAYGKAKILSRTNKFQSNPKNVPISETSHEDFDWLESYSDVNDTVVGPHIVLHYLHAIINYEIYYSKIIYCT